jgi:nucleotide-binding universal stress UspA family protein
MYRKALVPLDASLLAESVLSHVTNLVKSGCVEEVTILIVLTPYFPVPQGVDFSTCSDFNATRERIRDESIKYLANVESKLVSEGIKVRAELLMGNRPAEIISDYARNNGIDLIIISTHGYTGLKKLILGSVALEVLHNSHAPVLLIRPEPC